MAAPRSAPPDALADTLAEAHTISEGGRAENAYSVAPGTLIAGKYRVVRTIGQGGMGLVVEAFHLELQTQVAIKILMPELMAYSEAASRFQREARAVTKLTSPHVARVLDVGALPSGEPFMIMELLKGRDLSQQNRDPVPLSLGEALDYTVQACDAIADAHGQGIVHRDLKPANLFKSRGPDGEPLIKVLDFGVSKVLGNGTSEVSLTQTTTILGSALYMSPEQMRSAKNVDHRTDIYALGACLYEMLARRPPYVAASFPELCALVYSGPPVPVAEWSPDVPEALGKVIEKSLAHEPDARYATVADFVFALAPHCEERTRERIAAILDRYAPHLTLPPAAKKRRPSGQFFRDSAPSPSEAPPPAASRRWLVAGLVLALLAGGAAALWKLKPEWRERFFGGASAPPSGALSAPIPPATPWLNTWGSGSAARPFAPNPTSVSAPLPASSASDVPTPPSPPTAPPPAPSEPASVSVPVSATTTGSAAPPVAASAPSSAGPSAPTTKPSTKPVVPSPGPGPGAPIAPTAPVPTPPMANPGLGEETCFETGPDGTRKQVPCP